MGKGMTIEQGRWVSIPDGLLYWDPNFISKKNLTSCLRLFIKTLSGDVIKSPCLANVIFIPRLQCWYGDGPYCYSNLTMQPETWLNPLIELKSRCEQITNSPLNCVLANLYRDGNDSNGWHADNEPELGEQPIIASLSFGETRRFHLKHRQTKQKISFDLTPGSLLIMAGETQKKYWLHTVPKNQKKPKQARINLTYRFLHA
ncbi:alpha-ketoglutarate-dependent dioxygenase AlkB [Vibrio sinaloensis]|nr:alpha-ketoglutarate-dependent dioxygenase AlkB [Vibrio sinaloensis]